MFSRRPLAITVAGLAAALLAVAPTAAASAAPPTTPTTADAGLLVLQNEDDGRFWAVSKGVTPFGGDFYDDLPDALDWATELDLSALAGGGPISSGNQCLTVVPRTDLVPAHATHAPCDAAAPAQQWRVDDDRLQNTGTGLYVADPAPSGRWWLSARAADAPYRVLPEYLDGRPDVRPVVETSYDHETDVVSVSGTGPRNSAVVIDAGGRHHHLATTDGDGAFSADVPSEFDGDASVDIRFGQDAARFLALRAPGIDDARIAHEPDGTVVLYGEGNAGWSVDVGTGPRAADVVASGEVGRNGSIRVPIPDARPGDRFVVYQDTDGVRQTLTVPDAPVRVEAVDSPETELVRGESTPVPIGIRILEESNRVTPDVTLHAPVGTVFTPGTTVVDGEYVAAGAQRPIDEDDLRITDIAISDDGRTLTGHYGFAPGGTLHAGDVIRWSPTLDVTDPDRAPARI